MIDMLGFKVLESKFLPAGTVMVSDGETLRKFIWTANALADQEREVERLRAEAASWRQGVEDANRISQREREEAGRLRDRVAALEEALRALACHSKPRPTEPLRCACKACEDVRALLSPENTKENGR